MVNLTETKKIYKYIGFLTFWEVQLESWYRIHYEINYLIHSTPRSDNVLRKGQMHSRQYKSEGDGMGTFWIILLLLYHQGVIGTKQKGWKDGPGLKGFLNQFEYFVYVCYFFRLLLEVGYHQPSSSPSPSYKSVSHNMHTLGVLNCNLKLLWAYKYTIYILIQ